MEALKRGICHHRQKDERSPRISNNVKRNSYSKQECNGWSSTAHLVKKLNMRIKIVQNSAKVLLKALQKENYKKANI